MYFRRRAAPSWLCVNTERKGERRGQPRYPQNLKISITELPQLGPKKGRDMVVSGHIHNMSQGGLCVITSRALPAASVLRCDISILEAPIKITTLMQVRWTEQQKLRRSRFISGLSFLL